MYISQIISITEHQSYHTQVASAVEKMLQRCPHGPVSHGLRRQSIHRRLIAQATPRWRQQLGEQRIAWEAAHAGRRSLALGCIPSRAATERPVLHASLVGTDPHGCLEGLAHVIWR